MLNAYNPVNMQNKKESTKNICNKKDKENKEDKKENKIELQAAVSGQTSHSTRNKCNTTNYA